jgi:L-aspartate oxidase
MWPVSKEWFRSKGLDVMSRPLELGLFGHAINGGIRIDQHAESTVPGLYAAGETSTGPYGADRLGGNMLLNCQVFGARAGRHAAERARGRRPGIPESRRRDFAREVASLLNRAGGKSVAEVKGEIRKTMSRHVLVIRNGAGLETCLERLRAIGEELVPTIAVGTPEELIGLFEVGNLLETGELMTRAALMRTETRGGHFREDFPERVDGWTCPIFIRREDGKPCLSKGRFTCSENR